MPLLVRILLIADYSLGGWSKAGGFSVMHVRFAIVLRAGSLSLLIPNIREAKLHLA